MVPRIPLRPDRQAMLCLDTLPLPSIMGISDANTQVSYETAAGSQKTMRRRRGRGGGEAYPRRIARFIEPALLLLLRQTPTHGYGLMEGLRTLGFRDYPVDFSAVYRTLRGLEEAAMVQSDWDLEVTAGPPRRVYTITPEGEAHLAQWVSELRATDRVLHAFLDAYSAEYEDSGAG